MDCDKGAVEKMRKVNTRTSLFLCRLLAQQLNPKSQLPPEFLALLFFFFSKWETMEGKWEAREEETEREKKEDSHTCVWVRTRTHTYTQSYTNTHTEAAMAVATADPSAVWYEK